MKKRLGIGAVVVGLVGSLGVVAAPSASADYPECMEIQQPKITSAVATADGANFTWESKGNGATFKILTTRYYDGEWHYDEGWNGSQWAPAGGALSSFVRWEKDGKIAESVSLQVIQDCYGRAWGVPSTVHRNTAPVVEEQPKPSVETAYITLTPNKKWTEVQVEWAPVLGASAYQVKFMGGGLNDCDQTLTGTKMTWTRDSFCPMSGKYGTYDVWVTPVGPDINGHIKFSDTLRHEKPKVRCVNKSTLKVKNFKTKKCPSGWVER